MTIDKAMKAIESHLAYYMPRVPKALMNNIEQIVKQSRTIIQKEVFVPERKKDLQNLSTVWGEICKAHGVDPIAAKLRRSSEYVKVRVHFVRHVLLTYNGVTLNHLGRFLNKDHSTIIHMRDRCKIDKPIPPLKQRKVVTKTI